MDQTIKFYKEYEKLKLLNFPEKECEKFRREIINSDLSYSEKEAFIKMLAPYFLNEAYGKSSDFDLKAFIIGLVGGIALGLIGAHFFPKDITKKELMEDIKKYLGAKIG